MRAAALLIVLGLAACGQAHGTVATVSNQRPTSRAVDASTRVGGGPMVFCEDPNAKVDYAGPSSSLDYYSSWYVVDDVLEHHKASERESGTRDPSERVSLHVIEQLRGTASKSGFLSPRSREDLDAWLTLGSGHRALIGESAGQQVAPFVAEGATVYQLVPCPYPGNARLSRYAAHIGGDPLEAMIALATAGKGTPTWKGWQDIADPPRPKPKTWSQLTPEERSLDIEAPVPAEIRKQLKGLTIEFHGLTPAWRAFDVSTLVVDVAWNDGTSLDASRGPVLDYTQQWIPGKRVKLYTIESASPAFEGIALIGDVPLTGLSGDVEIVATLDPSITSLADLKAASAAGRSTVTWGTPSS
jgi:hypothetical protein